MRRDAAQNRIRLIEAAGELMRERGADVSMEQIAARAGVTRATLYRNFTDRYVMYEAVLIHDLTQLTLKLEAHPDDPLLFIRLVAEMMISFDRFLVTLATLTDFDLETQNQRIVDVVKEPLARAKELGLLRQTLGARDVVTACRMLASHWRLDGETDPAVALQSRLSLILTGLQNPPD